MEKSSKHSQGFKDSTLLLDISNKREVIELGEESEDKKRTYQAQSGYEPQPGLGEGSY